MAVHTLAQIKAAMKALDTYSGSRTAVYGPGGFDPAKPNNNVIIETDDRAEVFEKARKLQRLTERMKEFREKIADTETREDLLLGLLSQAEEDAIRAKLVTLRQAYISRVQEIVNTASLDEVDAIDPERNVDGV